MGKSVMTKQKFLNQWLRHFAPDLPKKQYEDHVKDQFIWHVFSWNLIESDALLVGEEARQAFNQATKTECLCCDLFGNGGVTEKLSTKYDTAEKIDRELSEFYVVAKDYSWTYIKTHEGEACGPYFFKKM